VVLDYPYNQFFRAHGTSHLVKSGPGTSFLQFFRALVPLSPYTVVLGHISNYSSWPWNLLLFMQWSWDILLIILKGLGTSLSV